MCHSASCLLAAEETATSSTAQGEQSTGGPREAGSRQQGGASTSNGAGASSSSSSGAGASTSSGAGVGIGGGREKASQESAAHRWVGTGSNRCVRGLMHTDTPRFCSCIIQAVWEHTLLLPDGRDAECALYGVMCLINSDSLQ